VHTSLPSLDLCQVLKLAELKGIIALRLMFPGLEPTILGLKLKRVVRLKLEQVCVKISAKMKRQGLEPTNTQKIQQKVSLFQATKAERI